MLIAPDIDPVALRLGALDVRWYSLAYMAGFLFLRRQLGQRLDRPVDLFLLGAVLSMYLWGRAIFAIVYDPEFSLAYPSQVLRPGGSGLAFHGALIGVALATWAAARKWQVPFLKITDEICTAVPLGIALGRLANFVNQELYGRVTDLPWGVVFLRVGPEPRHPSQIYEALLEGALVFGLMRWAAAKNPKTGMRTALFLASYACARFLCETFRQPDVTVGTGWAGLSTGQLLSFAMLGLAAMVLTVASRRTARG